MSSWTREEKFNLSLSPFPSPNPIRDVVRATSFPSGSSRFTHKYYSRRASSMLNEKDTKRKGNVIHFGLRYLSFWFSRFLFEVIKFVLHYCPLCFWFTYFFRYSRFDHRYVKISLLSPFMARTAPQIARGLFFLSLTSQKRTQFVCFSWPITEVYFYCYNNTNICKINTHSQGRTKPLWSSKFKDHTVCTPYVPTFFLLPATSPQFASLSPQGEVLPDTNQ